MPHACLPKVTTRSENNLQPQSKAMEQQENTPWLQEHSWAEYACKAFCRSGPKHHKQRFCRKCKALPLRGTAKARFTYAVGSSAGNTNRTILPGACDCHFNLCRKPLLFPVSQNHKFSELVKARASCSLPSFLQAASLSLSWLFLAV